MVWIEGGTFRMGSDDHYPEEAPAHRVTVDGFWIDRYPVTNVDFSRFVHALGHRTLAEVPPDPALYPDARPELLEPASAVFVPPTSPVDLDDPYTWWCYVAGADCGIRRAGGPSAIAEPDHPVVHVAYPDVEA